MKLLHISDLHFREHYRKAQSGYLSVVYRMTSPLVHLEKCFTSVDLGTIDGVVISGDLTENGSAQDYRHLKSFLDRNLNSKPVFLTLGNHDNKHAFRTGWGLNPEKEAMSDPYNQVHVLKDHLIICLDNALAGYPNGLFSTEQLDWLDGVITEYPHQKKILVFHHSLLTIQAEIPPAQWDSRFYNLIAEHKFVGLLCGHTHHQYFGDFANVPYTTAPSMSFRGTNNLDDGKVKFDEFPGYQICDFSASPMAAEPYYLLDKPRYLTTIEIGDLKI